MRIVNGVHKESSIRCRQAWFIAGLAVFCLALSSFPRQASGFEAQEQSAVVPGKVWERIEKPESIGYSSERLPALRAWVGSPRR